MDSEISSTLLWTSLATATVFTKLDRFARSTLHALQVVGQLQTKGVALRIPDFKGERFDTSTAQGKLILTVFVALISRRSRSDWAL